MVTIRLKLSLHAFVIGHCGRSIVPHSVYLLTAHTIRKAKAMVRSTTRQR